MTKQEIIEGANQYLNNKIINNSKNLKSSTFFTKYEIKDAFKAGVEFALRDMLGDELFEKNKKDFF